MINFHIDSAISGMAAALVSLALPLSASNSFAQEQPTFTTGRAATIHLGLLDCRVPGARTSAVGTITSSDGKQWTVPARTHFQSARKAADLYNQCAGHVPGRLSDLDLKSIPVLNAGGGDVFTAYIFADNYFEFYVNGRLLAVDPVPFTPFNSSVVRFRASRPFTIAIMAVDWEENLGLGSERNRGGDYHPGDGGLVAVIKDDRAKTVAITDGSWRAQTFYVAPLRDRACLKLRGTVRDSSACPTEGVRDGSSFHAAHWLLPPGWFMPAFNDRVWPLAHVFTNETVGVLNKPAYTNFTELFDDPRRDAQFIWSSNLILDNLVLMRKKVD